MANVFGIMPTGDAAQANKLTREAAMGLGPSGLNRIAQNNATLAATDRLNPTLALRNAQMQTANQAVDMRVQEMAQAREALRGQGQAQGAGINQFIGSLAGIGQGVAGLGTQLGQGPTNATGNPTGSGLVSGIAAAAPLMMLSDERTKTNVRQGSGQARSFLNELSPEQFQYKDSGDAARFGEGDQLGVMAQQLARTPAGRQMLTQDEQGRLAIDPARSIGPSLASMAYLFDRVERLENRRTDAGPTGERKPGEGNKAERDALSMSDEATGYNPEEDAARSLLAALDSPQGVSRRGRSGRGRGRAPRGRVAPPTTPVTSAEDLPYWNTPSPSMMSGPMTPSRTAPGGFSEAFNEFGRETGAFSPFRLRMPAPQEDGPMSVDPMMSLPRGR